MTAKQSGSINHLYSNAESLNKCVCSTVMKGYLAYLYHEYYL